MPWCLMNGQQRKRAAVLGRRISLIGTAKSLAVPVVSCVQARLRPDHLLAGRSWEEVAALVVVLAEAADPAAVRAVAESPADDGRPCTEDRPAMLRAAHAQAQSLRSARRPVPTRLALLECEYYRTRRRERLAAAQAPEEDTDAA